MKTDINTIISEGIVSIREWEPGVYVVQTEKGWGYLKEKVRNGELDCSFNAFVPEYVKELNSLSHEEVLKRVWGEKWKEHEWGK